MTGKFQVGEKVRVVSEVPSYHDQERHPTWGIGMGWFCGKEAVILQAYTCGGGCPGCYSISISTSDGEHNSGYTWPERWLELIEPEYVDSWLNDLELV